MNVDTTFVVSLLKQRLPEINDMQAKPSLFEHLLSVHYKLSIWSERNNEIWATQPITRQAFFIGRHETLENSKPTHVTKTQPRQIVNIAQTE